MINRCSNTVFARTRRLRSATELEQEIKVITVLAQFYMCDSEIPFQFPLRSCFYPDRLSLIGLWMPSWPTLVVANRAGNSPLLFVRFPGRKAQSHRQKTVCRKPFRRRSPLASSRSGNHLAAASCSSAATQPDTAQVRRPSVMSRPRIPLDRSFVSVRPCHSNAANAV